MKQKIKVAVIYGGSSGEHEISLQSAASVMRHLNREKFEIIPIGIDKDGIWHKIELGSIENEIKKDLPLPTHTPITSLLPNQNKSQLQTVDKSNSTSFETIDVVFPVLHGPLYEDGSIQGVCESANIAYVGSGVLASAISMDKDIAKRLVQMKNVPIVPYITVYKDSWQQQIEEIQQEILQDLSLPIFVKPANMGSSVGVKKVADINALESALKIAFQYDEKVLIEKAIHGREIEVAVLENPDNRLEPFVSIAGEINPSHDFYSYEAKYLDENGAELTIPAKIFELQLQEVQKLAKRVFTALELEGMARVDFFLEQDRFYFNEVNTIPGFTSISMYPKLWEASGIGYSMLLERLIDIAIQRKQRKQQICRNFQKSD